MGYYDPEIIQIKGRGVYPSLICQFPRLENPSFDVKFKEEMEKYAQEYNAQNKKSSKDRVKKKETRGGSSQDKER